MQDDRKRQSPVDRVRLIQRSLRCFYFGLIGLIPIIGVVMAFLAYRLFHRVQAENGEKLARPLRWGWVTAAYVLCWSLFAGASEADVPLAVLFCLLYCVFQLFLWSLQHWTVVGSAWNPARAHLFWGFQFAVNGFLGSAISVGAIVYVFCQR